MPFSSPQDTSSTALRLTEVQQPNTAATLSFCRSSRAFFEEANSSQFDAGSTTTGSSLRRNCHLTLVLFGHRRPSRSSLIAIVP